MSSSPNDPKRLKAELHAHVAGDPLDSWISYSAKDLIDELSSQGYDVIAITPHTELFSEDLGSYAHERGVLLIRGIEARIEGCDVLIYNADRGVESIASWDELERYRDDHPDVLVIAAHPFFPRGARRIVLERPGLFDAWEYSTFYSHTINMNRTAERLARTLAKPLVGTGDVHSFSLTGRTYTLIESEPTVESVVRAIKCGAVRLETRPLRTIELLRLFVPNAPSYVFSCVKRLFGR
ncbi:MAG: PHP-associated domain-containing protein [Candidatus Woesearchaeota archaeon]